MEVFIGFIIYFQPQKSKTPLVATRGAKNILD
jgi:hypothetical protein